MSPQPSNSSTVSRHSGTTKKRFLFDAHKVAAERFQNTNDGRKARHQSAKRRALLIELASFGNAVGQGACPSNKTLAKRLGWSNPTVVRFMKDLKTLGFVRNVGKSRFGGTMVRELTLNPPPMPSDSRNAMQSDSKPMPSDSRNAMQSDSKPMQSDTIAMQSPNDSPMQSPNDSRSAFELPIKISAHKDTCNDFGKTQTRLASLSPKVKTNGAGKENRETKQCQTCGDEYLVGATCSCPTTEKQTTPVRKIRECENCHGPTDGESVCNFCSDIVIFQGRAEEGQ
ncbi:MAG: helix-turn-helix domain-containing protein [Candidatus Acidiferrales bacterium]